LSPAYIQNGLNQRFPNGIWWKGDLQDFTDNPHPRPLSHPMG